MAAASQAAQRMYAASEDLKEERISEEQLLEVARAAGADMDERTCDVVSDLLHKGLDADVAEAAVEAMQQGMQKP